MLEPTFIDEDFTINVIERPDDKCENIRNTTFKVETHFNHQIEPNLLLDVTEPSKVNPIDTPPTELKPDDISIKTEDEQEGTETTELPETNSIDIKPAELKPDDISIKSEVVAELELEPDEISIKSENEEEATELEANSIDMTPTESIASGSSSTLPPTYIPNFVVFRGLDVSGKKTNFQCPKCAYTTSKYKSFVSHLDTHLENHTMYKCRSCDFTTSNKAQFTVHKTHCEYAYKVSCPHCDFVSTKHHIRRHILSRHEEVSNYSGTHKCSLCEFGTRSIELLESHLRMHSEKGDRSRCPVCDYKAPSNTRLKQHMNVHSESYVKHKCDFCGFKHANKQVVTRHMRMEHQVGVRTRQRKEANVIEM